MNWGYILRYLSLLACALILTSCGGGSGSSPVEPTAPPPATPDPAQPTSALGQRPTLATFTLPGTGIGSGPIAIGQRFAALSFNAALLTRPVPGTDRLLVAQQSGRISTFANDPDVATSTLIADLQTQTRNEGEQGLLGVAFDPNFASNNHLFIHYTPASEPRRSRIARFTWPDFDTNGLIDVTSELVILEVSQPFSNHNGGSVEFGPDGMLYIAFGDGGSGGDPMNNAQNSENLLGAILRIDVSNATTASPYRIPTDNPWANSPPNRGELWAIGLRNPFRMSFDSVSGDLWAGDVGQASREEIDIIQRGGNYGWRVREGTLPFDDNDNDLPLSAFTEPVIDLPRDQARSITGGAVYRGSTFGSINGNYIYGDFATENIWRLEQTSADTFENTLIGSVPLPAHFGEDSDGELIITSYTAGFFGLAAGGDSNPEPATLLSDTGIFTDLQTLSVAEGLIEYAVIEPHWSDGAVQRRWLAVPRDASITFSIDESWELPEGSLLVKQLDMPTSDRGQVRLETRIFIRRATGWQPFTWVWNTEQTDAVLTTAGTNLSLSVNNSDGIAEALDYRVPSQGECLSCHTAAAGTTLSTTTRQLNREFDYAGTTQNQLLALNGISMFESDILASMTVADYPTHTPSSGADGTTLDPAARSYLDVNCANCHRPGGPTGSTLDLRTTQALAALNAVDVPPESGDLGLANARIIAPGSSASSVLIERMKRLDGTRMPPVAGNRVDPNGVDLLERWVNSL